MTTQGTTREATAAATDGVELFPGMTLVAATLTMGLVAGVFALYAHTIMPGLRRTDNRTFVDAFQSIDTAIINPLFMATFFGALVLTGLAAALHLRSDSNGALPWIITAFVLYLIAVIITMAVHVPLNDAIKAAGNPDRIRDLADVRHHFNETRWSAWNLVRTVTTIGAFGSLAWAVLLYGGRR